MFLVLLKKVRYFQNLEKKSLKSIKWIIFTAGLQCPFLNTYVYISVLWVKGSIALNWSVKKMFVFVLNRGVTIPLKGCYCYKSKKSNFKILKNEWNKKDVPENV